MAATKNKGTTVFTGPSTGIGSVQADLAKRAHDLVPVAILVVALFALLAVSVWFARVRLNHLGGDPVSELRPCCPRGRRGGLTFGWRGLMALVFIAARHGYDDLSVAQKPSPAPRSGSFTALARELLPAN
jgi:hypothetical protein